MSKQDDVLDMHRQALQIGDRIWLPGGGKSPSGRYMGRQAIVTGLEPDPHFAVDGWVRFVVLDTNKLGSLRGGSVRLRRPGRRHR